MKTYHFANVKSGSIIPPLKLVSDITCENSSGRWYCEMLPDWLDSRVECIEENCILFLETHLTNYCIIIGTAILAMAFVIYILEKQKDKFV